MIPGGYIPIKSGTEVYVVAVDKGFHKSFRDDKEIVTFDSLYKFLNYVIIHTKYLAEAVDRQMGSDVINRFIKYNIVDEVYTANCDIDGCYDEVDITSVEYRSHKVGKTKSLIRPALPAGKRFHIKTMGETVFV